MKWSVTNHVDRGGRETDGSDGLLTKYTCLLVPTVACHQYIVGNPPIQGAGHPPRAPDLGITLS